MTTILPPPDFKEFLQSRQECGGSALLGLYRKDRGMDKVAVFIDGSNFYNKLKDLSIRE